MARYRYRTVSLLLIGLLLLASCSSSIEAQPTPEPSPEPVDASPEPGIVTMPVTPEDGGLVELPDIFAVTLPPGSIEQDGALVVEGGQGVSAPPLFGPEADGEMYFFHLSLTSTTLTGEAELAFAWQPDQYDVSDPAHSFIVHYNEQTGIWEPLESTYDPSTGMITATVDHFSWFGFVSPRDMFNSARDLLTLKFVRLLDSQGFECLDPNESPVRVEDGAGGAVIGGCVPSPDDPINATRVQIKNLSLYEYQFVSDPIDAGVDFVADPNSSAIVTLDLSDGEPIQIRADRTQATELRFVSEFLYGFLPIPLAEGFDATGFVGAYGGCAADGLSKLTIDQAHEALVVDDAADFLVGMGELWLIPGQDDAFFCAMDELGAEFDSPLAWGQLGMRVLLGLTVDVIKIALHAISVKAGVFFGIVNTLSYSIDFLIARLNDMAATLTGHQPYIEIVSDVAPPSPTAVPRPSPIATPTLVPTPTPESTPTSTDSYPTAAAAAVAGAQATWPTSEVGTPVPQTSDHRNAAVISVPYRPAATWAVAHVYVYEVSSRWYYLNVTPVRGGWPIVKGSFGTLQIESGCVNVRLTPDLNAEVVDCLTSGTKIEIADGPVYSTEHLWWYARDRGWITHDYVMCAGPEEMRSWLFPPDCS